VGLGVPFEQLVGSFRYLTTGKRWEWSDEVALMQGYQPGAVVPTTELVLSHTHGDDRPTPAALIDTLIRDGQPFSSRHRIIDTRGRVHVVVVAGDRLLDDAGAVIGVGGFYVDITDAFERDFDRHLSRAVKQVAAHRAVIEQAKGILMFVYNLPPGPALHVLRWRSEETDTPLRDWCDAFVRHVTTGDLAADLLRRQVDHALLAAHECPNSMPA
jgi:ANTAR domain/PAS fold